VPGELLLSQQGHAQSLRVPALSQETRQSQNEPRGQSHNYGKNDRQGAAAVARTAKSIRFHKDRKVGNPGGDFLS
jgi:hypothetical protein